MKKGFTLIELIIAIIVVAVVISIAIPTCGCSCGDDHPNGLAFVSKTKPQLPTSFLIVHTNPLFELLVCDYIANPDLYGEISEGMLETGSVKEAYEAASQAELNCLVGDSDDMDIIE